MLIIGVDLAWGEKKPDGVCFIAANRRTARISAYASSHGDEALLTTLCNLITAHNSAFITIDAPIVCPNRTGTRPVDRLTHTMFHQEHAACHPANLTKCPRPVRIRRKLERLGFTTGWKIGSAEKLVAEVYPHPAIVRLFGLPRIIKYKKGRVTERRREFARYQRLLRDCLRHQFPFLRIDEETRVLLNSPWHKAVEDKTDALLCALIGLWHWRHGGKRSQVIGDVRSGFILLPEELRQR